MNVFPVREGTKVPAIKDWRARAKPLQEWQQDPEWKDHDRWGAPCGPENDWWVLDVDPRHGGLESLAHLQEQYGELPPTHLTRTPSTGLHYRLKWVPMCARLTNTAGKLGPGLDIRVEGGMVLVPPSAGYETMSNASPAEPPAWLLALLLPSQAQAPRAEGHADGGAPIRNPTLHLSRALQSALEEIAAAPAGSRDATMNRNAYGVGRLIAACGIDPQPVIDTLIDAAIKAGYDPHKALECCTRAVQAGMQNPREVAPAGASPAAGAPTGTTAQQVAERAGHEQPLRPCPPKPGAEPADTGGAAWQRWSRANNDYLDWNATLRNACEARLVVVQYGQSRVLYHRVGLRRIKFLGTIYVQCAAVRSIGAEVGLQVSPQKGDQVVDDFLKQARAVTELPTLWDTGSGFYFYESPAVEAGETPTWDTILNRLSDPEAFLAHVWSVFEPRFKGRQVLWLQGDGNDGKSIAIKALFAGAGIEYTALSDGDLTGGNQFLFSSIWDKAAVLVNESKNVNVLMTGMVHKLTGRDAIPVEYKFGQRFNAEYQGVVFVTSNNLPQIERTRSNLTRLSVVTIRPGDWVDNLESRLRREVPALLHRARLAYAVRCPRHFEISLNETARAALDGATSFEEEQNATAFAMTGIRIEGDEVLSRKEVFKRLQASGSKLADVQKVGAFYKWLARQDGVAEVKVNGERGFKGLKP